MEHPQKSYAPGIVVVALVHKHRHALVDGSGEFSVLTGAEDGEGAGVGVDAGDVLGGEGENPPWIAQVVGSGGKEGNANGRAGSGSLRGGAPCQGEEAEFVAAVHRREESFSVLEVKEAHKLPAVHEIAEEVLVGVVGGNTGGDDDAGPTAGLEESTHPFGKDRVGVDIAPSGEGVLPGATQEAAGSLGCVQGVLVFQLQGAVGCTELLNEPFALGSILGLCNLSVSAFEKFLLFELDSLPRRI